MSNSALANLRPGTVVLISAFRSHLGRQPQEYNRDLLALGRKVFRYNYPREVRVQAIRHYCVGSH